MSYLVTLKPSFLTDFIILQKNLQKKVQKGIDDIAQNAEAPRGNTIKPLVGHDNMWRYRIGDLRLVYQVAGTLVQLLALGPRGRIYEESGWVGAPELEVINSENIQVFSPRSTKSAPYSVSLQPSFQQTNALPLVLTSEILTKWLIPPEFHAALLKCQTEDELTNVVGVPDVHVMRVLDCLWPKPAIEVITQPDLVLDRSEDLLRYAEGDLLGFLLKLDAEQEKFVDWALEGPTLVKGGPGSGKSTVALYRVVSLYARHSGTPHILFTTFTTTLAMVSEQLLGQLFDGPIPEQVKVANIDKIAFTIAATSSSVKLSVVSPYKNIHAVETALADVDLPAKNILEKNFLRMALSNLSTSYILDEFELVIEGQQCDSVEAYLKADRVGREHAFNESLRRSVWALYEHYSKLIERNGELTFGKIRIKALQAVQSGNWTQKYDYVLIDEAQDLTPCALALCIELCKNPQGIFLTADSTQSLYNKGFRWKNVHETLRVTGRTRIFSVNYRSTEEIGMAASELIADPEVGDLETTNQRFKNHGVRPQIAGFPSKETQIEWLIEQLNISARRLHLPIGATAILVPSNDLGIEVQNIATKLKFPARFMKSNAVDLHCPEVKILTMYAAKGLEFPIVAIPFLEEGIIPLIFPNAEEKVTAAYRNSSRSLLYVACTRAMRHLILTYSNRNPSRLIDYMSHERWEWN